jgi:hypothetical protein
MNRKFDAGPALVALGAVVLLVALFLTWFDPGGTAWEVFEVLDLLLAAIALASLAVVAGRLGDDARVAAGLAAAALVIVAVQLIDPPPAARGADIDTGGWMALAAAGVMLVGAVLTLASISVTVDVTGREARRRVAALDLRPEADEEPATATTTTPHERDQRTQPFAALAPDDEADEEAK